MKKKPKFFQKVTATLQRKGLQFTLSFTFTLVAVFAVFVVTVAFANQFSVTTEQLIKTNNQNIVDQVNVHLDNYIHNLMQISNTAYYNIIKETDIKKDEETIADQLQFLYKTNASNILNIALFEENGDLITVQPPVRLKEDINPASQGWFQKASSEIENVHFTKPYVENVFKPIDHLYHWVVSFSRSVELSEGGSVKPGVLLVNMNFAGIEKIANQTGLSNEGYLYIMTQEGELIYHPQLQKIYAGLSKEDNHRTVTLTDGTHQETFGNEEKLVTVKTMGYTGWKIIAVAPVGNLGASVIDNRLLLWMLTVAVIIALIGINIFISSKITTPLRRLERAVSRIEQDINYVDIPQEGTYEIRHLATTLMNMTNTMRVLMDDIVKQQESIRETEMLALQSQINPHFLYNTLDSTVWMIESGRYEGAVTMITALARFFRISLSRGKNVISLEQELEQVRNYLMIQEIRYKNKFMYSITLDSTIKNVATIKLIIQPVVENAIYHAMDYMYEEGEIQIRAYPVENGIYIDIEDNGPGMTKEQVTALVDGELVNHNSRGSGLGFKNVVKRIKLFYGDRYGLTVISEPDEGTTIRIYIPNRKMEEHQL
ncbi:sensor histidine kinase [Jeotgalibaca sp. MA1X17-3]|uniref:sensor histidine kinase n=1 Tax=Jeotgalibaca sp. MA1X17-3 TaxID=2908211 RepID=UPI001F380F0E|nr:sensor histidine kinase [Jeotgalibaca sp. MA1X17-3]UJF16314.1 sensor histidine kinase [Jeotgalibaca sp. MA1X17-3]